MLAVQHPEPAPLPQPQLPSDGTRTLPALEQRVKGFWRWAGGAQERFREMLVERSISFCGLPGDLFIGSLNPHLPVYMQVHAILEKTHLHMYTCKYQNNMASIICFSIWDLALMIDSCQWPTELAQL